MSSHSTSIQGHIRRVALSIRVKSVWYAQLLAGIVQRPAECTADVPSIAAAPVRISRAI